MHTEANGDAKDLTETGEGMNKETLLVKEEDGTKKKKTHMEDKAFLSEVVSALFIWDMVCTL